MTIYEIAKQKMEYINYSLNTIKTYMHYIHVFLNSINKTHDRITASDFQSFLINYNFSSISQQNQIINAIRFLYKEVLNKKYDKVNFDRPRAEKHLPRPIDESFLLSKISSISNLKHKAIISLAYSVGLRKSEIINLKVSDIDSNRMQILIKQSKNNKDRFVPLTQKMLEILRAYYKAFKPNIYMFEGQSGSLYSATSISNIMKKYIGSNYNFHQLRHSCFTHLTDKNVDIRVIQKLAGHSSSKTTEIYTKVSTALLNRLPLAL